MKQWKTPEPKSPSTRAARLNEVFAYYKATSCSLAKSPFGLCREDGVPILTEAELNAWREELH